MSDFQLDFVLGTGRCGSTLFHEILCRHRAVGFLSNLEDRAGLLSRRGKSNGRLYRALPPGVTRKGRLRFAPSEGYQAITREIAPLIERSDRDLLASDATPWLARKFDDFFRTRADGQTEPVFLHKFTGWPRTGFLHEIFPDARYVNVVRDGRAVVNSWLQMPWWLGYRGPTEWHFGPLPPAYEEEWEESGRSFVVLAGIAWKILLDATATARDLLPAGQWIDVRYEDLVTEPTETCQLAFDFLGIDPDPDFAARLATYSFDPSRASAFERDLGDDNVKTLTASLESHLTTHGYPT